MEPGLATRMEELTTSCPAPVIISLSGHAPPTAAAPLVAASGGKSKNVLKERFILKNCPTGALHRRKVRRHI